MTDTVTNVAERVPQAAWAAAPASIMVYVDFDAGCDKRIKVAADWAAKFNVALIGVAGWSPGGKPAVGLVLNWNGPKTGVTEYRREMERLGESFRTRVGQAVQTVEWRGSFHLPREVIPAEARAADLVIIGSHPVRDDVYRAFDPGTVILNAGRPVLVVPDAAAGSSGARVLVAWKDTREARHAVQSALPYLKVAKHVSLVEIAEGVLEMGGAKPARRCREVFAPTWSKGQRKIRANPRGIARGSTDEHCQGRWSGSDRRRRLRTHAIRRMGIRRRHTRFAGKI